MFCKNMETVTTLLLSMLAKSFQMKISRHKRIQTSLLLEPNTIPRRERNDDNSPKTMRSIPEGHIALFLLRLNLQVSVFKVSQTIYFC